MTETVLPLNLLSCISTVDVGWVQYGDARGEAPCKKKLRILPLPGGKGVGGMGIKIKYAIGKAEKAGVCYLNCNPPNKIIYHHRHIFLGIPLHPPRFCAIISVERRLPAIHFP